MASIKTIAIMISALITLVAILQCVYNPVKCLLRKLIDIIKQKLSAKKKVSTDEDLYDKQKKQAEADKKKADEAESKAKKAREDADKARKNANEAHEKAKKARADAEDAKLKSKKLEEEALDAERSAKEIDNDPKASDAEKKTAKEKANKKRVEADKAKAEAKNLESKAVQLESDAAKLESKALKLEDTAKKLETDAIELRHKANQSELVANETRAKIDEKNAKNVNNDPYASEKTKQSFNEKAEKSRATANESKAKMEEFKSKNGITSSDDVVDVAAKKADDVVDVAAKKADDVASVATKNADNVASVAAKKADDVASVAAKKADDVASVAAKKADDVASVAAKKADDVADIIASAVKKLSKSKMISKNMSEFAKSARDAIGELRHINVYSSVKDPSISFSITGSDFPKTPTELDKLCDRLTGLKKNPKTGNLELIEPGSLSGDDVKVFDKKTGAADDVADDVAKKADDVVDVSSDAAKIVKKTKSVKKTFIKGSKYTFGKVMACAEVAGMAYTAYDIWDYSKTHNRRETEVYAAQQVLTEMAFEAGGAVVMTGVKLGYEAGKAVRQGRSAAQAVRVAWQLKRAEQVARNLKQIENARKAITAVRTAVQVGRAAQTAVVAAETAVVVAEGAAAGGSFLGSLATGMSTAFALGPVGFVAGVVMAIGTIIFMCIEKALDEKAKARARLIESATKSMDIAARKSLSNTFSTLSTRKMTFPDPSEIEGVDESFISDNYVGIYDDVTDSYMMMYWEEISVNDMLKVANNDNETGVYIYCQEVRDNIRKYFADNQYYNDTELKAGFVMSTHVVAGVLQPPNKIMTPARDEYYKLFKEKKSFSKFSCNTATEKWSSIKYKYVNIDEPFSFPLDSKTPISVVPNEKGYRIQEQETAGLMLNALDSFYKSFEVILKSNEAMKDNEFLNPYYLVAEAKRLLGTNNISEFDFMEIDVLLIPLFIEFCNTTTTFLRVQQEITDEPMILNLFILSSNDSGYLIKNHLFTDEEQPSLYPQLQKFYDNHVNDYRIYKDHFPLDIETIDNYAYMFYLLGLDTYKQEPTMYPQDIEPSTNMIINYEKFKDVLGRLLNISKGSFGGLRQFLANDTCPAGQAIQKNPYRCITNLVRSIAQLSDNSFVYCNNNYYLSKLSTLESIGSLGKNTNRYRYIYKLKDNTLLLIDLSYKVYGVTSITDTNPLNYSSLNKIRWVSITQNEDTYIGVSTGGKVYTLATLDSTPIYVKTTKYYKQVVKVTDGGYYGVCTDGQIYYLSTIDTKNPVRILLKNRLSVQSLIKLNDTGYLVVCTNQQLYKFTGSSDSELTLATNPTPKVDVTQLITNPVGYTGGTGQDPNSKEVFGNLVKTFALFLWTICRSDPGFGMNLLGYIYSTKDHYSLKAMRYYPKYINNWLAVSLRMVPNNISDFDNKQLDYIPLQFTKFTYQGKDLVPIENPIIEGCPGMNISLKDLKYETTTDLSTIATYCDQIPQCIGFSVRKVDNVILFYQSPQQPENLRITDTPDILFSFFKFLQPAATGSISINLLTLLQKYSSDADDIENIINKYDPVVKTMLRFERKTGMQILGRPDPSFVQPRSNNTKELTPREKLLSYLPNIKNSTSAFILSPDSTEIYCYLSGSYIYPSDNDSIGYTVYNRVPNKNLFPIEDSIYPNNEWTEKYVQTVPDEKNRIPIEKLKSSISQCTPKNDKCNTKITEDILKREKGTPVSNNELARYYDICNVTPNCLGFQIGPSAESVKFYQHLSDYKNHNLISKDKPDDLLYHAVRMDKYAYGNKGISPCGDSFMLSKNPNKCTNIIWIAQAPIGFIVIDEDNMLGTMETLSSSIIGARKLNLSPVVKWSSINYLYSNKQVDTTGMDPETAGMAKLNAIVNDCYGTTTDGSVYQQMSVSMGSYDNYKKVSLPYKFKVIMSIKDPNWYPAMIGIGDNDLPYFIPNSTATIIQHKVSPPIKNGTTITRLSDTLKLTSIDQLLDYTGFIATTTAGKVISSAGSVAQLGNNVYTFTNFDIKGITYKQVMQTRSANGILVLIGSNNQMYTTAMSPSATPKQITWTGGVADGVPTLSPYVPPTPFISSGASLQASQAITNPLSQVNSQVSNVGSQIAAMAKNIANNVTPQVSNNVSQPVAECKSTNTNTKCSDLVSPKGLYKATLQGDGNFCVYDSKSKLVWQTGLPKNVADRVGPYTLSMQTDGNLVIYNGKNTAIWSSKTASKGTGPYSLKMQDDNNLVVYDSKNKALWARR